jgi:hypothetical protein
LSFSNSEIEKEVKKLDNESKALKKSIYKLAWYMRGALDIEQAFMLDYSDREIISEIIKDNLKTTEETNLPFF